MSACTEESMRITAIVANNVNFIHTLHSLHFVLQVTTMPNNFLSNVFVRTEDENEKSGDEQTTSTDRFYVNAHRMKFKDHS